MILSVVTNPDNLVVVDSKVDSDDRSGVATFEFAKPLMRDEKTAN